MVDLEIKRGYVVLPDNRVKFGIRVINNENSVLIEVEVILDYSYSLFELEGNMVNNLGNVFPSIPKTAEFILNPLGCVHKEEIGATVRYRDHTGKKHVLSMRPKEVHCVCPFLKEKVINRAEYLKLSSSGHSAERGVNFENIPPQTLVNFLTSACKNRLYKVDSFSTENGTVLYLAGESIGEKACYLLTAAVLDRQEFVQVLLHASSDKPFGLHGFLNEILENLRHLVRNIRAAREIGYVKTEQVINIIDSVVQHTNFTGETGSSSVNIEGSSVLHTQFGLAEEEKAEKAAEENLQKQQEEEKRLREEEKENLRRQQEEEKERLKKEKEENNKAKNDTQNKKLEEIKKFRKQREEERLRKEEEENLRRQQEEEKERLKKEKEEKNRVENDDQNKKLEKIKKFRRQREEEVNIKKEKELAEKKEETRKKKLLEEQKKAKKAKAPEIRKTPEIPRIPKADQTPPNPQKKGASSRKMVLVFGSIICLLAFIGWAMADDEPTINSFEATPYDIFIGESSSLSWDVSNAATVSITPDIGTVPSCGNQIVSPTENTTYILTAENEVGVSTDYVIVHSKLPETYTNSIDMDFVLIPEGEFMMGSPKNEKGRAINEGPVHKVTIEEPFYLGKYEVTQEQWFEVMGANPSDFKGDKLPVEQVFWNEVQEFIIKLNEMEGSNKYRLPSEAEWEYACRSGTSTRYSFGDDSSKLVEYAWYSGYEGYDEWKLNKDKIKSEGIIHSVGQKKPNSWGLYDMHGNVWEWVQDDWHENYEGAPSDGSAWEDGNCSDRVYRGGSWSSSARGCRSVIRNGLGPNVRGLSLGFRLLRNP